MKNIFFILVMIMPLLSNGQTDEDILRYSMTHYGGTARFQGVSGAFSSLGGEFGAINVNPGTIGLYRGSELTVSPSVFGSSNHTSYFGTSGRASELNFHFENLGLVLSRESNSPNWEGASLAIGFNRLANFHNEIHFTGFNENNSLLDHYLEQVNAGNGTDPDNLYSSFPFGAGLAYEAYLINPTPQDSNQYYSLIPDGMVQQTKTISTEGSHDEVFVAFGANYRNKLQLGASVGFPTISYYQNSSYTESDPDDLLATFGTYTLTEEISSRGTGINIKGGVTFQAHDNIRIGAAIHSPTYIAFNEDYINYIISDSLSEVFKSPAGNSDYSITTPWRAIAGVSFIDPKWGFASLDYEYVDYSAGTIGFSRTVDQTYEGEVNSEVKRKYTASHIIRGGVEAKLEKFRLRAGASYATSPFRNGIISGEQDLSNFGWSLGAGYRTEGFFTDLSFSHAKASSLHVPYTLQDQNEIIGAASIDNAISNVTWTLGFRF